MDPDSERRDARPAARSRRVAVAAELADDYVALATRFGWTVTDRRTEASAESAFTVTRIPSRAEVTRPTTRVVLELATPHPPDSPLARAEERFWNPERLPAPLTTGLAVADWVAGALLALAPLTGALLLVDGPENARAITLVGWTVPVLVGAACGGAWLAGRDLVARHLTRRPDQLTALLRRRQDAALREADRLRAAEALPAA